MHGRNFLGLRREMEAGVISTLHYNNGTFETQQNMMSLFHIGVHGVQMSQVQKMRGQNNKSSMRDEMFGNCVANGIAFFSRCA